MLCCSGERYRAIMTLLFFVVVFSETSGPIFFKLHVKGSVTGGL